jgi:hypothetical protein
LHVNLHGKALFFKTIGVQQNEVRYDFEPVRDDLTLAEAAEQLEKQTTGKAATEKGKWFALPSDRERMGGIDAELRHPAAREQQELLEEAFEVSRCVVVSAPREPDPGCTPR